MRSGDARRRFLPFASAHEYSPLSWSLSTRNTSAVVLLALLSLLSALLFLLYTCLVTRAIDGGEEGVSHSTPALLLTTRYSLDKMRDFAVKNAIAGHHRHQQGDSLKTVSFNAILQHSDRNRFRMEANDVLVFLHMQKTAGTSFEKFLTRSLNVSHPCGCNEGKKKCSCLRPNSNSSIWLFSRYSTGWACGLHADYTESIVSGCVNYVMNRKEGERQLRRYYLTTFLREPVERFVSEYTHVARGATWSASRHLCNGKYPSPDELPMCFDPEEGWTGVELDEFLSCPYNLAFNRQTRMLADLTLVNCYDWSSIDTERRERVMLESAKSTLKGMAFFGVKELMNESQLMFEKVFDLRFAGSLAEWNRSKSTVENITEQQMAAIRERNNLDAELYSYAVRLFNKRLGLISRLNDSRGDEYAEQL